MEKKTKQKGSTFAVTRPRAFKDRHCILGKGGKARQVVRVRQKKKFHMTEVRITVLTIIKADLVIY